MNRTGLVIALAVAATVGLVFGLRPDLDLKLAALFFDPERGGFWRAYDPVYLRARDVAVWLVTLVAAPAVAALAAKFVWPRRPLIIPGRAIVLMLVTLALAPGAHFLTDWIFAGVFSFLVVWVVHGWLYRWPRTRISDAAVERALERIEPKRV